MLDCVFCVRSENKYNLNIGSLSYIVIRERDRLLKGNDAGDQRWLFELVREGSLRCRYVQNTKQCVIKTSRPATNVVSLIIFFARLFIFSRPQMLRKYGCQHWKQDKEQISGRGIYNSE